MHYSTAVTGSTLEIHLRCAFVTPYKQINHLLGFSLKLQSPLKEKGSAYIRFFLELGFITLTRTYHSRLSFLAHSAVDGFPKGQLVLSQRISVWIEKCSWCSSLVRQQGWLKQNSEVIFFWFQKYAKSETCKAVTWCKSLIFIECHPLELGIV